MNSIPTKHWQEPSALAHHLLESHAGHLTVAMPLGLGKANHLINALYDEVSARPETSLTILTALSLQTPQVGDGLQKRFFAPLAERLYSGYTELKYARDLLAGELPSNVVVSEFFLQAGAYLNNEHAQANYISANYSHVSALLLEQGVDVVMQMVAKKPDISEPAQISLSCNPDITLELLSARAEGRTDFILVGEVNQELPFMGNDAAIQATEFAHLLDGDCAKSTLFNVPKQAVSVAEYAAGFHASSLIPDGGTLQIGIGSVGDAVAHALIMRHRDNDNYRAIITALNGEKPTEHLHLDPFTEGLYGVSEMLVDVFLDLLEAGVLKREVNGVLIHGGFFVGPKSMYQRLCDMPEELRDKINMTHIGYINGAHVDFKKKQQNRQHARFVNNAMKASLLGAIVSDGLESGQVISGVGGQYDFVRQSFALANARSIIMIKAVREKNKTKTSNIVWSYGHTTIPRHLRDIVISEYGVADLRGQNDAEVIKQMLSICDLEFQSELLEKAKQNKKIASGSIVEKAWQKNSSEVLAHQLSPFSNQHLLPEYPFGTDFTDVEQRLITALQTLKQFSSSKLEIAKLIAKGAIHGPSKEELDCLNRLELHQPGTLAERFLRFLILGALHG